MLGLVVVFHFPSRHPWARGGRLFCSSFSHWFRLFLFSSIPFLVLSRVVAETLSEEIELSAAGVLVASIVLLDDT